MDGFLKEDLYTKTESILCSTNDLGKALLEMQQLQNLIAFATENANA